MRAASSGMCPGTKVSGGSRDGLGRLGPCAGTHAGQHQVITRPHADRSGSPLDKAVGMGHQGPRNAARRANRASRIARQSAHHAGGMGAIRRCVTMVRINAWAGVIMTKMAWRQMCGVARKPWVRGGNLAAGKDNRGGRQQEHGRQHKPGFVPDPVHLFMPAHGPWFTRRLLGRSLVPRAIENSSVSVGAHIAPSQTSGEPGRC